ncbi:MAG: hypothetical protein Q9228_007766, partial [Teloschistes exilis]
TEQIENQESKQPTMERNEVFPNNNGPESAQLSSSSYLLTRDHAAGTRLNGQYFLWKMEIGWLLHPSLAPTSSFRAADLGTGTAIWALDLAQSFPVERVDGFDIDLQQCPPSEWLPSNVIVREWDILSALPSELEAQYDVVHTRLLLAVIRDNNPRPVLRNALRMLKKGGCLQWDELDQWGTFTVEIGRQQATRTGHSFQKAAESMVVDTLTWIRDLPSIMEEVGFVNVKKEEIDCDMGLA